jgi:hypothetical protein
VKHAQRPSSLKKRLVVIVAVLGLAGCATVQPQQAVNQMDPRSERFNTQDCRQARQIAMSFDDNVGGRMGLGLGLGLLLGPFGLPFAIMADASQAEKRNAVLAELKKHCDGPMTDAERAALASKPAVSDAQRRLDMLVEMKAKGLLSDEEFERKRKELVGQL